MMCQLLYSSLFQSALPYSPLPGEPKRDAAQLKEWGLAFATHLEPYERLFAERFTSHASYIRTINAKLPGLKVYDRDDLETQFRELQAANAILEAEDAAEKQQRRDNGEPDAPLLTELEDIRESITEGIPKLVDECPSFQGIREPGELMACAYTVFEALLIQHDYCYPIFDYDLHQDAVLAFMTAPVLPERLEDVQRQLIFSNIVDYKTYFASYAEIFDTLFTRFSGKDYIFTNVSKLVEYFLDLIGFAYVTNYRPFLKTIDTHALLEVDDFAGRFESSFMQFLSNIEHTRHAVHAFLNPHTMSTLAAITGQYNILERHKKEQASRIEQQAAFAKRIEKLWNEHPQLGDHTALLHSLYASKSKTLQDWLKLFGPAKTKKIVMDVLRPHKAIKGMSGFKKRTSAK